MFYITTSSNFEHSHVRCYSFHIFHFAFLFPFPFFLENHIFACCCQCSPPKV